MARTVSLQRYRLSPNRWEKIINGNPEIISRLGRAFNVNRLFGPENGRYGFVNCTFAEQTVVGYFAHEGTKIDVDYDRENNQVVNTSTPFAHVLFAIYIPDGVVGFQNKQISDFVDLNLTTMRTIFPMAVSQLLNSINVPMERLTLEQERIQLTSQQLYVLFRNNQTTELTVTGLKDRKVPTYEEFKIFNPRVNHDLIFREVIEEDLDKGLDRVDLSAPETADLRETATAQLLAVTGDVVQLKIIPEGSKHPITVTNALTDAIKTQVDSDNEQQAIPPVDVARIQNEIVIQGARQVNFIFTDKDGTGFRISDLPLFRDSERDDTTQ